MHNQGDPEPLHWRFALGATFARLEQLTWEFDVVAETGKHAYAGVPSPNTLVLIIDGFLSEPERLMGGNIGRLYRMRAYLQQQLEPIYQAGQQQAQQHWRDASLPQCHQFLTYTPEDIRGVAWRAVPADTHPTEANWFVEGFCYAWACEYGPFILSLGDDAEE